MSHPISSKKGRLFARVIAVQALAIAALSSGFLANSAKARPDALPFELAVVLRGCAVAPFDTDQLASTLEAEIAFNPLVALSGSAAAVRLWVVAPRCGESDARVRIAVEIAGTRGPRELLAIVPVGGTSSERSVFLAQQAHAALGPIWPGVVAAAEGNPYVVSFPTSFEANPYRRELAQRERRPVEWLPPNPYRR